MLLSSSSVDRRIPEHLSLSRERNLTVEAPGWSALGPPADGLACTTSFDPLLPFATNRFGQFIKAHAAATLYSGSLTRHTARAGWGICIITRP